MARLLVLMLAFVANCALADVTERFSTSYYSVVLSPGKSLLSQFNASSPVREDGQIYHGYTTWNVHWSFRWNTDVSGLCRIANATTKLDVKMILPNPRGASSRQLGIVASFSQALRAHEQGHYDIARRAAREIDRSLLTMPRLSDCNVLEARANAKANEMVEHFNEVNRQYDRETHHGKTQGARLDGDL